ncbi:MAG: hypothetical protein M4579_001099 [Chaenotheca gracillima]|nr:MAG: hypothetical protein M4579_001099 [Chaenotheca gracillima]
MGAVCSSSIGGAAIAKDAIAGPPPSVPSARKPARPAFNRFWQSNNIRKTFLSHLPKDDMTALRLVCHDFSDRVAPLLFRDLTVVFRSGSFTRPARMAALERIGKHVRRLTFRMPHDAETFLPPLLDPVTGQEQIFLYVPQTNHRESWQSKTKEPKYGSWEMTDILIKQYGPLFHAATNIPSFIRAMSAMPAMRHLKISCLGQEPSQRYRRSVVDYALISLRIAIERAPLVSLSSLTLQVHPGALLYLRPNHTYGSTPRGPRRWAQIRKLALQVDAWEFEASLTDHLKLLHDYLFCFSSSVTRLSFTWKGAKGPCPFTLDTNPLIRSATAATPKPPTKAASFKRPRPLLRRLIFPKLYYAELANMRVEASEICSFIDRHRHTLSECNFDEIDLQNGDWDDALAVLTRISGSEKWKDGLDSHKESKELPPLPPPKPSSSKRATRLSWAPDSTVFQMPTPIPIPPPVPCRLEELSRHSGINATDDALGRDCMFFLRTSIPVMCP